MAGDGLGIEDRDGIRVLTLRNPPSNALTPTLRGALLRAVLGIGPDCARIVLCGEGPGFSSGLPIEPMPGAPDLAALCAAVAEAPVPVVAVLQGLVLGPGAELALAASHRLAAPDARIAFPEVALGLCPEGGTTRRLPRLVGSEAALQLLLSGRALGAAEAQALGLVDALCDRPLAAALTEPVDRRDRGLSPAGSAIATAEAAAAARRAHPQSLPAAGRIIACVEASVLLTPEAHQAFEAVAREDLEASPEAAALRAVARAERRAALLPAGVARPELRAADRIAVLGSGPGLQALAQAAQAQGVTVDRAAPSTAPVQVLAEPGPTPGGARVALVLGGAAGALGLALGPEGRGAELAVPSDAPPEAVALAHATLRRIGLAPVLVGSRPVLGAGVMAAGVTALAHLARSGVPQRALVAALTGFGAAAAAPLPKAEAPPRDMAGDEILTRWLAAMANEGLRLLEQGIARRPSDIDLVLVQGHGFPRWRCGPMHQADARGLLVLRRDLRQWEGEDPIWAPAPLLDRLIRDSRRLADLDRAS